MPPSSRRRLRPTKTHQTVVAVGEGETEGAFLLHLKSLYCPRDFDIQVTVNWTYGGSPSDIIAEAVKYKQSAHYDRGILLIDTDIPIPDEARARAGRSSMELIENRPCIEGFFLAILDGTRDWSKQISRDCKREFHAYIPEDEKTNAKKYENVFTKQVLEAARTRVAELDRILKLFTEL
jgi:hypothetical protein